jgi:hypothetical protein
MQEVWKRPEHRSKMKESMNKARRRPGYGAKRSKISQEIWTRPGFRKKALDRLGQVQQWILMELISGRHIGKDGITRITTEDLYRDYYHIENDSKGGYKYYGKNYSQDIRQKVKSAYVRGHKSFDVLVEKGLIKKKWDFDGAYFTLTPAGRDRISSRVGQVDKHNFNVSVKEGENAESKA